MSTSCTLITGASSGIGRSIAQRLSGGSRLVLTGRSSEKLEAVRAACEAPDRHLVWVQDLGHPEVIGEALTSFLGSNEIAIDHFVHSAGIFEILPVRGLEMSGLTRLFNVNLFSAVEIIRVLVSRRANHGMLRSITLISSISARLGAKGYSIYAASKGGLNALARSLAVELAPDVRVNAVLPGGIETESTKALFVNAEFVAAMKATYPLGFGRPEDVADAVAFLISGSARWITGQEIVVDGGRSIV
jgi:NAD(P)-dependent dehydrogenase (short-subunit alcohol dehydrogenase family)